MNAKVMVSCALTGAGDTTNKSQHVPVTPVEIADSAREAAKAGASIVHIHVRDPKTGAMSHDPALFREVVERIRSFDEDIVMNLTAGGGGDWIPSENDPATGGPGTDIQTPAERHQPIAELLPEICTLDCGSYNYSDLVYISPTEWLRRQAQLIQRAGVKPELECFDLGHIRFAKQLMKEGLIDSDPMFQFCLGIPWGADADVQTLTHMCSKLPENAHWAAFAPGRLQMPMAIQAALLGGHVRVGLEDNLYLKKGVLATNAQLVDKIADMIRSLGSDVMTPGETRALLQLRDYRNGAK